MIDDEIKPQNDELVDRSIAHSKKIIAPVTAGFAESIAQQESSTAQTTADAPFVPVTPTAVSVATSQVQDIYPQINAFQQGYTAEQAAAAALIARTKPKRPLGITVLSVLWLLSALVMIPQLVSGGSVFVLISFMIEMTFAVGLFFGVNIIRKISIVLIVISLLLTLPFISILLVSPARMVSVFISVIMLFYLRSQSVVDYFEG